MADTVRYLMEEMIPELEDLEERGYFTRAEIKQIVKRRTDFEYLLKRRAAVKADYLKCEHHLLRGSPYAACPAVSGCNMGNFRLLHTECCEAVFCFPHYVGEQHSQRRAGHDSRREKTTGRRHNQEHYQVG